jgi:RNA polymerase sigma factor (sigma-70 family)
MEHYNKQVHVITDLDAYIEAQKADRLERDKKRKVSKKVDNSHCNSRGCWCHSSFGKTEVSYLEQKRKDGLINEADIEIVDTDTTYEEIMANKYMYIVAASASSWGNPTMFDQLFSVGQLGLLNGIRTWNMAKGTQTTYYNRCIKNAMINVMRADKNYRDRIVNIEDGHYGTEDDNGNSFKRGEDEDGTSEYWSWNDFVGSDEPNPEEHMLKKERVAEAKAIIDIVIGDMNEREKDVFDNRILEQNETLEMMAARWGCGKSSIERDQNRILEKLKTSKQEYNTKLEN